MLTYIKLFEQWNRSQLSNEISRIAFVGDIMQHSRQLEFEKNRGFSYIGVFDGMISLFNDCDLIVGNLETTISHEISGFPYFSAPKEFLDALKNIGFDVLITSNNHSLDYGENGIKNTYESIRSSGMIPIGSMGVNSKSFNINGIRITLHAFTTFVNEGKSSPLLSVWNGSAEKREGINIAYIHSGEQYDNRQTDEQLEIINALRDKGFDGVIFTHSHIPGPLKRYDDFFVVFGMGNFISDQKDIKGSEYGNCIIVELLNQKIQNIDVIKTVSTVSDDGETRVIVNDKLMR